MIRGLNLSSKIFWKQGLETDFLEEKTLCTRAIVCVNEITSLDVPFHTLGLVVYSGYWLYKIELAMLWIL